MTILRIDATALGTHGNCLRRFLLTTQYGYTTKLEKIEINFGNAVHKFEEQFLKAGGKREHLPLAMHYAQDWYLDALTRTEEKKSKEYLTDPVYLTKACLALGEDHLTGNLSRMEIATDPDGLPIVEAKFAIPVYQSDKLTILLCGTLDGIYRIKSTPLAYGCYVIGDVKTTSARDLTNYFDGYRLSTQLMTYYHAVRYYAQREPNSVFADMVKVGVGIRIIAVSTNGVSEEPGVVLSPVYYFKEDLYEEYVRTLEAFVSCLALSLDSLPPRSGITTGACQHWAGNCPYFFACASPDERSFWATLDNTFKKKEYNPLLFR